MEPISINPVEQSKSKALLVIGIVLVLIVVALGLYFWRNASLSGQGANVFADEINALNVQSSSDSVSSIEKDLQSTNLDNLDKEASAIDAVLNAAGTQ